MNSPSRPGPGRSARNGDTRRSATPSALTSPRSFRMRDILTVPSATDHAKRTAPREYCAPRSDPHLSMWRGWPGGAYRHRRRPAGARDCAEFPDSNRRHATWRASTRNASRGTSRARCPSLRVRTGGRGGCLAQPSILPAFPSAHEEQGAGARCAGAGAHSDAGAMRGRGRGLRRVSSSRGLRARPARSRRLRCRRRRARSDGTGACRASASTRPRTCGSAR